MSNRILPLGIGLLLWLSAMDCQAQVWPGDVNNNGIVNNIDMLYMAEAFFEFGPARSDMGIEWEEKPIDMLWPDDFPNGVNHAFADCDGDGLVLFDEDAIRLNYGLTHGTVTPDDFSQGTPGVNPSLHLEAITDSLFFENSAALLQVNLGDSMNGVNDVTGIAFTIRFDPDVFNESFVDFIIGPMFESGADEVMEVRHIDPVEGTVDVALARVGSAGTPPGVSGAGVVGLFFIVIEDNVVGLTGESVESSIYIEKVKLVGEGLDETTVYADSTVITIVDDGPVSTSDLHNDKELETYPQPAHHFLMVNVPNQQIMSAEITDLSGRLIQREEFDRQWGTVRLQTGRITEGLYVLKVLTDQGWLVEKIIISP